jgi:hypothetical protein
MIFRQFIYHFLMTPSILYNQYDYRNYPATKQYTGFEEALLS